MDTIMDKKISFYLEKYTKKLNNYWSRYRKIYDNHYLMSSPELCKEYSEQLNKLLKALETLKSSMNDKYNGNIKDCDNLISQVVSEKEKALT